MAKFVTGPDVNPFYRATQSPIDVLQSADAATLALSVPFVKLTQVDPYTGKPLEKPPFTLDVTSAPGFGRQATEGRLLERPLVSLESVNVKAEATIGLDKQDLIDLSFVVHDPYTVFFGDDTLSTFRALIQEGNSFLLEYGWRGNSRNDMLNGVGLFDEDAGLTVPSIARMRIMMYTWQADFDSKGEMKLNVKTRQDGELSLREAKLSKFLDLNGFEPDRVSKRKRPRASLPQQDADAGTAESVVKTLNTLSKVTVKPHGECFFFGDILDALVAPAVTSACLATGYAGVDLYLGNFSKRCKRSSPACGSRALADKSIGDALVPVKQLTTALGQLHAAGETVVLRNFIEALAGIVSSPSSWADDRPNTSTPQLFVGTATRHVGTTGLNFVLFFADRHLVAIDPSEFDRGDMLDPADQSKEKVLARVRSRNIPILQFGHAGSIISECSFNTIVDDPMRSVFLDNAFKNRKSQVQALSQPDPLDRKGRSQPEDYAFFSGVQATVTMLGNFVFSWGQTVWLDVFNVHPISGLFTVHGIENSVTPAGFVTKLTLTTTGTDPLNTRRRKSRSQIEQEAADAQKTTTQANARRVKR